MSSTPPSPPRGTHVGIEERRERESRNRVANGAKRVGGGDDGSVPDAVRRGRSRLATCGASQHRPVAHAARIAPPCHPQRRQLSTCHVATLGGAAEAGAVDGRRGACVAAASDLPAAAGGASNPPPAHARVLQARAILTALSPCVAASTSPRVSRRSHACGGRRAPRASRRHPGAAAWSAHAQRAHPVRPCNTLAQTRDFARART
jgi:hypothetical protein